jgi:hypothetical protein
MERILIIGATQRRRAERIVNAFVEEGIINAEDDITAVLKPNDPKLKPHGKTTKVEAITVFRDGDGVMDAAADTYKVKFP